MQDRLIKYHDFPGEGTLGTTRLRVVRESVEQRSETQRGCCLVCFCSIFSFSEND